MRIKNPKIGDPMGFKLNESSNVNLDELIDALKVYHGNCYVVGYDKSFIESPHYHIHWFAVKNVSESAVKTFRNSLKNKFPNLTRSDKLYCGEELASANPNHWIGYCIKENLIKSVGIDITDEIKILSKSCFETKRQNKVYSEKKVNEEKEKKDFRKKMFDFVKKEIDDKKLCVNEYDVIEYDAKVVRIQIIKFFMENERWGSLKKHHIDTNLLFVMSRLCNWSPEDVDKFIYMY